MKLQLGVMLLVGIFCFACTDGQPQEIHVSTAEELLNAIGSNRNILLAPGDYTLGDMPQKYMDHLIGQKVHDGTEIIVRGVENLRITGPAADRKASILATPRYANVLTFEDCSDIALTNVVLGHAPEKGYCTGGVLVLKNCSSVAVEGCRLFGCGTEGLVATDCEELHLAETTIDDCTYGIATLKDCKGVRWQNCRFEDNTMYYGINILHCLNVVFDGCTIRQNRMHDMQGPVHLLNVSSSSAITFRNGMITGNEVTGVVNDPESILIDNTKIQTPDGTSG